MYYKGAKFVHLFSLIIWLGPSTGGYILFLMARYGRENGVVLWLFDNYISLVHIEALGLLTLIISGVVMRAFAPELRKKRWLKRKITIVFTVFVPLELANLYLYDFIIKKAFQRGIGVTDALLLYDRFSLISALLLAITVPLVFYLAVFKPGAVTKDSITLP